MATETKDMVKADVALFGSLKTEKDRLSAIDRMEIGANDSTLNRRFAVYMWTLGATATGNAPPAADVYLKAFNAKFRGGSTGRPVIKEESTTFATMASVYGQFAALGFVKLWKSDAALVWVLDNVKGAYSTRGKFIKQLAALEVEPDVDTLKQMWADAQNPPKLGGKATAMAKAVNGLRAEASFKPLLVQTAGPVRAAYAKLIKAAADFEAAVKAGEGTSTDDSAELAQIMADAA